MCKRLFIIGNGFDLFHGIPSSYSDFRDYIDENVKEVIFSEAVEIAIEKDMLWSDFEMALANLQEDELEDYYSDELVPYNGEEWKEGYNESYTRALKEILYFAKQIKESFRRWVKDFESIAEVKRKFKSSFLREDAIYITFNYTTTLETVYKIPTNQIFHIHGSANSNQTLIVGHGSESLKNRKNSYDPETDDIRLYRGEEIVLKYYRMTYKDVFAITKQNSDLWNLLSDIQEVYILGHSISDIDRPYFQKIKESISNASCKWFCSYHAEGEKEFKESQLRKIGIDVDNIRFMRLDEYC